MTWCGSHGHLQRVPRHPPLTGSRSDSGSGSGSYTFCVGGMLLVYVLAGNTHSKTDSKRRKADETSDTSTQTNACHIPYRFVRSVSRSLTSDRTREIILVLLFPFPAPPPMDPSWTVGTLHLQRQANPSSIPSMHPSHHLSSLISV